MAARHKWVPTSTWNKRSRRCTVCGLAEVVTPYTYRSPRNGYKRAFKRRWYKKGNHVIEFKGYRGFIPLPCDLVSIALPEVE